MSTPKETAEFHATIRDGMIEVPVELRERFKGEVKVTIAATSDLQTPRSMLDELLANPRYIPDFKPLTRDEAHER